MASASAPGKVILFGEHAVVYGEPAIAAAIDLRTRVMVRPLDEEPTKTAGRPLPGGHRVNGRTVNKYAHLHVWEALRLHWPPDGGPLAITTEGNIPSAAGLGSSAALSVATTAALLKLGEEPTEEAVARAAYDVEYAAQGGRGSPTDTTTSTHGHAVLVDREPHEDLLWEIRRGDGVWCFHHAETPDVRLVVGNTGTRGRTADQVARVARFRARSGFAREVIAEIGDITREGLEALKARDLEAVGRLMDRNHNLLTILGVSTPELERLVRAARPLSYGAKITGAGGGGSMVALTDDADAVSRAIRRAGGTPYVVTLGGAGVDA